MLRERAWQATDDLTRAQLVMFHELGDQIHLSEEDRRRALRRVRSPPNRQRKRCCGVWAKPLSTSWSWLNRFTAMPHPKLSTVPVPTGVGIRLSCSPMRG
jgi:hypothetical protein